MTYTIRTKVIAIVLPDNKSITQSFVGCDFTEVGALKSVNKQIKHYSNNPYVEKVEIISTEIEKF